MSTIRVARRHRYTAVARQTVNDARLSFRARGVLLWLLDKPDDWAADSESISAEGREGRDAVRSALKELVRCGYLKREKKQHKDDGRWFTEWTVYEVPPGTAFQSSETRPSEDQALKDRRLIQKQEEAKTKADPDCVTCEGVGWHYHATAGREGPCNCTKEHALKDTA